MILASHPLEAMPCSQALPCSASDFEAAQQRRIMPEAASPDNRADSAVLEWVMMTYLLLHTLYEVV